MIQMGFDRPTSITALKENNNNLGEAIEFALSKAQASSVNEHSDDDIEEIGHKSCISKPNVAKDNKTNKVIDKNIFLESTFENNMYTAKNTSIDKGGKCEKENAKSDLSYEKLTESQNDNLVIKTKLLEEEIQATKRIYQKEINILEEKAGTQELINNSKTNIYIYIYIIGLQERVYELEYKYSKIERENERLSTEIKTKGKNIITIVEEKINLEVENKRIVEERKKLDEEKTELYFKESTLLQREEKIYEEKEEVMNEYYCPITLELMKDPVVAIDGRSYERHAIENWFLSNKTSPANNLPISSTNLVQNIQLKNLITTYQDTLKNTNIGKEKEEEKTYLGKRMRTLEFSNKIPRKKRKIEADKSWKVIGRDIINSLSKEIGADSFLKPVDPIKYDIPGYLDIIKRPMDLGTIKKKLVNNEYADQKDYIADVELVFTNCLLFNGVNIYYFNQYIHIITILLYRKQTIIQKWLNH